MQNMYAGLIESYRLIQLSSNYCINPLSSNSDQDQFSPNNIYTLSTDKLWELINWSPKKKCLDLLSNSLNSFFKEMYGDQFGELVCGYWGLTDNTRDF